MHIKEITVTEFEEFANNHVLSTHYQTLNYALLCAESDANYDFLGYVDELGVIKAVALIIIKKINLLYKYGYSPKGFLIDYFDKALLTSFTEEIKAYYAKSLVFIKINPEIAIGQINPKTKIVNYNQNIIIRDYLKSLGYKKLKDNIYFESQFPRYNAILNLQEYNFNNLSKNTKNKIRKSLNKGLVFELAPRDKIDILYDFIKNKKETTSYYYKDYYNIYSKNNSIDLLLVKIDYEAFLINAKKQYDVELENNNHLADVLISNATEININKKMTSDKRLLSLKNDVEEATIALKTTKEKYIAGALVIKQNKRVNILISGIDVLYKRFNANYFLHYNIIEYYKNNYKYLDLNGITGDFSLGSPYWGLNNFKMGFKPDLYEFIGEFDLVINEHNYNALIKKGLLAKELNKK